MARSSAIPSEIGTATWSAAVPARARIRRISSVAYALDEIASEGTRAAGRHPRRLHPVRREWVGQKGALEACIDTGATHEARALSVDLAEGQFIIRRHDQRALLVSAEPLLVAFPEVEPEGLRVSREAEPAAAFG
jgi:hypothetical protein